jgi:hypothetical protein
LRSRKGDCGPKSAQRRGGRSARRGEAFQRSALRASGLPPSLTPFLGQQRVLWDRLASCSTSVSRTTSSRVVQHLQFEESSVTLLPATLPPRGCSLSTALPSDAQTWALLTLCRGGSRQDAAVPHVPPPIALRPDRLGRGRLLLFFDAADIRSVWRLQHDAQRFG